MPSWKINCDDNGVGEFPNADFCLRCGGTGDIRILPKKYTVTVTRDFSLKLWELPVLQRWYRRFFPVQRKRKKIVVQTPLCGACVRYRLPMKKYTKLDNLIYLSVSPGIYRKLVDIDSTGIFNASYMANIDMVSPIEKYTVNALSWENNDKKIITFQGTGVLREDIVKVLYHPDRFDYAYYHILFEMFREYQKHWNNGAMIHRLFTILYNFIPDALHDTEDEKESDLLFLSFHVAKILCLRIVETKDLSLQKSIKDILKECNEYMKKEAYQDYEYFRANWFFDVIKKNEELKELFLEERVILF